MRKATPKQRFVAACVAVAVEIDHDSRNFYHHVDVVAPAGKMFSGFGVERLSVWDGDDGAPDWNECLRQLEQSLPLVDCPDYED